MEHTLTLNLKWFGFHQNNSGGYFVTNENVCEYVFIQARNAEEAVSKAETFCDNSDSCPCCGERWSFWTEDSDGTEEPMIYETPVRLATKGSFRKEVRLHHFDGRVEAIKLPDSVA